ncbi:MAG: hypothetical protein PHQ62_00280 [Clostridia bacterium]|nr:hypothetical protein [Clostridia bacterium]
MEIKDIRKDEQRKKTKTINKVLEVCDRIDRTLPVEYQIKQLFDWCLGNFFYNYSAKERFLKNDPTLNLKEEINLDKLMKCNVGVCGQFAEAFCLMCTQIDGVRTFYVKTAAKSKDTKFNGNHALCLLEIDNKQTFVDVSCGLGACLRNQNPYDFFLKSWKDLQKTYNKKRDIIMEPLSIMVSTSKNIDKYYDYFKDMDNEIFASLANDDMKSILENSCSINIKTSKREILEDREQK